MDKRIKPWVTKKIVEYIGEEEPTLTDFICQKVVAHSPPQSIQNDVAMVSIYRQAPLHLWSSYFVSSPIISSESLLVLAVLTLWSVNPPTEGKYYLVLVSSV